MSNKLGSSNKPATDIRQGPNELGDIALINLHTELTTANLNQMPNAIKYSGFETGKHFLLNLK